MQGQQNIKTWNGCLPRENVIEFCRPQKFQDFKCLTLFRCCFFCYTFGSLLCSRRLRSAYLSFTLSVRILHTLLPTVMWVQLNNLHVDSETIWTCYWKADFAIGTGPHVWNVLSDLQCNLRPHLYNQRVAKWNLTYFKSVPFSLMK